MRAPSPRRLRHFALWFLLELIFAISLLAFAALADTPAGPHRQITTNCMCGCCMSKSAAGCSKMCDLPKFSGRRWAVTCSIPRASSPAESPNAQPHLPHYTRSERASN